MNHQSLFGSALLAAAAFGLAGATSAQADSIVYTKAGNVWLANPDGTGQYQVTTDGTPEFPYRSPSQADDGTIVASHLTSIVRMKQNGAVLNTMDPPPLINSVSQPVDGPPLDLTITPDGSKVAYTLVGYTCPIGAECLGRSVTAVTPAGQLAPQGNIYTGQSSWVDNTRLLTFAGFLHQVNTFDVGTPSDVHWWDDQELFGQGNSTDQGDGEVNRQGTAIATIRGYGDSKSVMWMPVTGDVATGSRGAGTLPLPDVANGCLTDKIADLSGPTWSPSGTSLAWRESGAIQVWADTRSCAGSTTAIIEGGAEPDWGPAPVNPGPRESGGKGPGGTGGIPPTPTPTPTPPPGGGTSGATPTVALAKKTTLRKALTGGVSVRFTNVLAGKKLSVTARSGKTVVAKGRGKASKAGAATIRLTFTAAARKKLRAAKKVKLSVSGGGASATITLKR